MEGRIAVWFELARRFVIVVPRMQKLSKKISPTTEASGEEEGMKERLLRRGIRYGRVRSFMYHLQVYEPGKI